MSGCLLGVWAELPSGHATAFLITSLGEWIPGEIAFSAQMPALFCGCADTRLFYTAWAINDQSAVRQTERPPRAARPAAWLGNRLRPLERVTASVQLQSRAAVSPRHASIDGRRAAPVPLCGRDDIRNTSLP